MVRLIPVFRLKRKLLADTRRAVQLLPCEVTAESLLCLHALSSFQRTGGPPSPPLPARSSASPPSGRFRPSLGEPLRLLPPLASVNPFSPPNSCEAWKTAGGGNYEHHRLASATGLAPVRRTFQYYDCRAVNPSAPRCTLHPGLDRCARRRFNRSSARQLAVSDLMRTRKFSFFPFRTTNTARRSPPAAAAVPSRPQSACCSRRWPPPRISRTASLFGRRHAVRGEQSHAARRQPLVCGNASATTARLPKIASRSSPSAP